MLPEQWFERFTQIVAGPESNINVAEAALVIAADEYPDLEVVRYLAQLDELARQVRPRIDAAESPEAKIDVLNDFLFNELNFRANNEDYYDPRNSYLNDVLERRIGIPITLSLVYLEIGWRLGCPLGGVAIPGHFIVKWKTDDLVILLDPFDRGHIIGQFSLPQPANVLSRLSWVQTTSSKQILVRLLSNLRGIFLERQIKPRILLVLEKILALQPEASDVLREAALLAYELKLYRRARLYLSDYVRRYPQARGVEEMRTQLGEVESVLLRLN
jgi:regulator of sirC expression with transglutaminase-like and TPR domain